MSVRWLAGVGLVLLVASTARGEGDPETVVAEYLTPDPQDASSHGTMVWNWLTEREPVTLYEDNDYVLTFNNGAVGIAYYGGIISGDADLDEFGRVIVDIEDVGRGWIDIVDDVIVGYVEAPDYSQPNMWARNSSIQVMAPNCSCWGAQGPGGKTTYKCKPDDCEDLNPPNCGTRNGTTHACTPGLPPELAALLLPPVAVLLFRRLRCAPTPL